MNLYYSLYFADENNVFFANERVLRSVKSRDFNFDKEEIIRLDWDGNVIARYCLKDQLKQINAISYSEKLNSLYISTYDENDERVLYKAVISD